MDDVTLLVIWIAFGLICFGVASKKGRNEWVAFGMGLLFGVFTLIYYLVARGSKEYELDKAKKKLEELEK